MSARWLLIAAVLVGTVAGRAEAQKLEPRLIVSSLTASGPILVETTVRNDGRVPLSLRAPGRANPFVFLVQDAKGREVASTQTVSHDDPNIVLRHGQSARYLANLSELMTGGLPPGQYTLEVLLWTSSARLPLEIAADPIVPLSTEESDEVPAAKGGLVTVRGPKTVTTGAAAMVYAR